MKIYIKNMVCNRCKLVINNILNELNIVPTSVALGEIDFGHQVINATQLNTIKQHIEPLGFALIDNKKNKIIEDVKHLIMELVHRREDMLKIKISHYLKKELHYEYGYLSNLFSATVGITIEQYFINQKIEKVKELLVYDEINLTEIAYRLDYSSLAHLSRQFKKVTGLTPSQFKRLNDPCKRLPLDKIV